jgi:hypothetical protein
MHFPAIAPGSYPLASDALARCLPPMRWLRFGAGNFSKYMARRMKHAVEVLMAQPYLRAALVRPLAVATASMLWACAGSQGSEQPEPVASAAPAAQSADSTPQAADSKQQAADSTPADAWPREATTADGHYVFYQPQPDSLIGNVLAGRMVISFTPKGASEPVFGTVWLSSKLESDRDAGTGTVRDLTVTRVHWPDATDEKKQILTKRLQAFVQKATLPISLPRLSASLATAKRQQKSPAELKNEPPKIVFTDTLSVLLLYDGEPRFKALENADYERALNTPFVVVHDTKRRTYYLTDGGTWYGAKAPKGPWKPGAKPPDELVKAMPKDTAATPPPKDTAGTPAPKDTSGTPPKGPPAIVVATEPTSLIVTDGPPKWLPATGKGELLYVKNTETPWIKEVSTKQHYLLLSGRWFRAATTAGPWAFVRPDSLPPSFKEIPAASDIGGVRASVAGTPEAEEEVLDASVPQTAAIKRSEAKLEVHYDGEPKFEAISGTSVERAVNTQSQVLRIEGKYYAVDEGVWFASANAKGPWAVADKVPEDEISKIPPSSAAYNTTHVHVYESTPEVVYVGYTPGYMWSFPYYGVPVYGTGYYYPPYWGSYYYPGVPTFGMSVGFNPWTGWSVGFGMSAGFVNVGVSFGGWGASYYRPYGGRYYGGAYGGYGGAYRGRTVVNTGNINIGNNYGANRQVDRAGARGANNIYARPESQARVADRGTVDRASATRPAANTPNNVLSDQNGNVARRNNDGSYDARSGSQWSREGGGRDAPQATPQATPQAANIDRQGMERDYNARQQGMRSESMRAPSYGGGGGRGFRR